ncbi:hypothetical protein GGF41_003373, partial [Coemansia sp. RSA 2531]
MILPPASITTLPVFPDLTHFPRLVCLRLSIAYPFGDDMLFQGNSATLRYLDMKLYPAAVDFFCKYAIFMCVSHPPTSAI